MYELLFWYRKRYIDYRYFKIGVLISINLLVYVKSIVALGDTEGSTNASKRLVEMEEAVMSLTDSRVEGAPDKINPRHTTLRSAVARFNRYRTRI